MKRAVMTMLLLYSITAPAAGQEAGRFLVSTDLAKAICGTASLHFGYGFASNWSAGAEVSLDLTQMKGSRPDEEDIHDSEFASANTEMTRGDFHALGISVRYWPAGRFRKWFAAIGIRNGNVTGPDMTAEAGYAFKIWKESCITVSYMASVRECIRKERPYASGISVSISYNF